MKNNFLTLATLAITILLLNACKKPVSKLALYVPKDAAIVFTVDTKSIIDKITSSGITLDSLAGIFSQQNDGYAMHWGDIKNSGINLSNPFYIFSKATNSIQQGNLRSGALIAEVQDASKLASFFKKQKVGGEVLTSGKYKYMALGNDYVAGWTDKILIISLATGGNISPGTYSTGEGTLAQQQLTALFTQSEAASIAAVGEFRDVVAKPGDIHFFTNASASLNAAALPGMDKVNELLKDSYSEGVINFDNGKMNASSATHYNKTLSGILDKYPSRAIDAGILKSYPGPLGGFAIIAFNPKVLLDILRYLGFDTMADGFASNLGFTTNDVVNAFSGDIAVMFSPRSNGGGAFNSGGFIASFIIGDKAAFDKVLNGLLNKQIVTKNGDEYQLGISGGHGFVIETGSNNLFIASSDELIKAFQSPSKNTDLPADIEKQITGKSMALYANINDLIKNKSLTDSDSGAMYFNDAYQTRVSQSAKETFKDFIATSATGDKGAIKGNMNLNFMNANENSLASLVKFIAVVHEEDLKRKAGTQQIYIDSIPSAKDRNN